MERKTEILISQDKIAKRIGELGQQISKEYQGKSLTVICVLKGAFIFAADLLRAINVPVSIEFIGVSSYQGTASTGNVRITNDLTCDVVGKHILLVEDIIDSGITIDYLCAFLKVRSPASLKICTFLSKPKCHKLQSQLDYVGFDIDDKFVIGYGLDLDGRYRELPYLAELI